MSDHVRKTIEQIVHQIEEQERDLVANKRMVNSLCTMIKEPAIYSDEALAVGRSAGPVRPDAYYGQPLQTALRMILERRHISKQGPATVNELYQALVEGGYKFQTDNDEYAKRGLYSTLTKATQTFHKLPNGSYGLLEWYPGVKEAKVSSRSAKNGGGIPETQEEAQAKADAADEGDPDTATDDATTAELEKKAKANMEAAKSKR